MNISVSHSTTSKQIWPKFNTLIYLHILYTLLNFHVIIFYSLLGNVFCVTTIEELCSQP